MTETFTRSQKVLVVSAIFAGARQRIDLSVPEGLAKVEFDARKAEIWTALHAALGTLGAAVADFYRQVTGREMCPGDFAQYAKVHRLVEILVNERRIGLKVEFPALGYWANEFVADYMDE